MTGKIIARQLKGIRYLEFEIPGPGVWLLTGENGCGKTTLLAALRRIGYSNAFATHFPASQVSDRLDDFSNTRVTYELRGRSVTYSRRDIRWVPTPRRNVDILRSFNYSSVEFIGATADRISPREDDFVPARIRPVSEEIIEAANDIFSTNRFSNLRMALLRNSRLRRDGPIPR